MDTEKCPLPLGVFDVVFDHVQNSSWSKETFRACILVSSTFRHLTVTRLYRDIRFDEHDDLKKVKAKKEAAKITLFKELINYPPNFRFSSIIPYIKSLDLSLASETVSANLLSIIKSFSEYAHGLTHFSINGSKFSSWTDLPKKLRRALQSLLQLRSLITLKIKSLNGFDKEFLQGSQLQVLEFQNIEINADMDVSAAETYEPFNVISPMAQLRTINLEFRGYIEVMNYGNGVDLIHDETVAFRGFFEVRSNTLDRFLTGPNYPSLRALEINIKLAFGVYTFSETDEDVEDIDIFNVKKDSRKYTKAITNIVLKAFPRLASSSKISFKVNVEPDGVECFYP